MNRPAAPGDGSAVTAAMVAAGALIAQQVAGRAARDALFLSTFQVAALPFVMIGGAVTSGLAVLAFSAALSRRSPARVVPPVLAAGTVLLLAEWGASLLWPRLAAVAVYLHMAAFGATVVSGFWSLVNERFDPHTGRRAMGQITLGSSLGGVAGGLLAWSAADAIPLPAMLGVMAAFNVVSLLALRGIGPVDAAPPSAEATPLSGLRVLREVPYLRDLAWVVALGAAAEAVLDFTLNAGAAATFGAGPRLLAFFALFHTVIGLLAFLVQVTLSRPALRRLGLPGTVSLRPAVVAAAAALGALHPGLWMAALGRGSHGVLHNSLFRAGYELLFTPVAERRKRPTKTIVDVGFDKVGTVAGGLLVLALVGSVEGPLRGRLLFVLAAAASLAGLAVSRRLQHGYVGALEESLRSGVVRLDMADVLDATTSMTLARTGIGWDRQGLVEAGVLRSGLAAAAPPREVEDPVARLVAALRSSDADRVRRALREARSDPTLVGHIVPLLARNDVFLDVLDALRVAAPRAIGQLLDALLDPQQDVTVRRRIPRVLRRVPSQRAADGLVAGLQDASFGVRRQCAITLARMVEAAPEIALPRTSLFSAAIRELESAASWRSDGSGEDATADAGSQTPGERGLAHVFTLLSLAVDGEPMRIAYWAVVGSQPRLRGTALEYLENVLPEDVRRALWPHVGVGMAAAPARSARTRQHLVQDLMESSHTMGLSREALKRLGPRR